MSGYLNTVNVVSGDGMPTLPARSKSRGWGWRRTGRIKTAPDGRRWELHATRGWKCIGRAPR